MSVKIFVPVPTTENIPDDTIVQAVRSDGVTVTDTMQKIANIVACGDWTFSREVTLVQGIYLIDDRYHQYFDGREWYLGSSTAPALYYARSTVELRHTLDHVPIGKEQGYAIARILDKEAGLTH